MGNNNLSKHANLQQILSPDWDLKNVKVNAYIFKKKGNLCSQIKNIKKIYHKKDMHLPKWLTL